MAARRPGHRRDTDELVRAVSLIGPASHVTKQIAAFRAPGGSTLAVTPLDRNSQERIALMAGSVRSSLSSQDRDIPASIPVP